jgi:hypothetical protein
MPVSTLGVRSVVRADDGEWRIPSPTDPWGPGVAVPGARDMTVRERIGLRVRRISRQGVWIEVDKDTASIHSDVLTWCRRYCNSETPDGTFRIAPKVWAKRANDTIDYPYVPELDDPSETIRELAHAEWLRRCAEADLLKVTAKRHDLIRAAGADGHSRRRIADLVGLSFARVQQLTRTPPTPDDRAGSATRERRD